MEKTVEANGVLVRRYDGWRIQFEFDDGTIVEQEQSPFSTQAEAQAALDLWCEQNAVSKLTAQ